MPLEALLRQREDVMESEARPFDFDPVSFTPVTSGQASFTPAKVERVLISLDTGLLRAIDAVAPNRSAWIAEAARARLAAQ